MAYLFVVYDLKVFLPDVQTANTKISKQKIRIFLNEET